MNAMEGRIGRFPVDLDLGESSIRAAASMMSARVEELTIFACSIVSGDLDKYDHLKCKFVMVPPQLMANKYAWAALCRDMMVWSDPTN